MGKRKVRGILDQVEAEHDGAEWEWEKTSADFVPGMGLGATKQATRWAYIGYLAERKQFIDAALSNPKGRPKKPKIASKDSYRAFSLWKMAKVLGRERRDYTVNSLIKLVVIVEDHLDVPMSQRAFPPSGSYASSISRGKKILEIDSDWNSAICEKIDAI